MFRCRSGQSCCCAGCVVTVEFKIVAVVVFVSVLVSELCLHMILRRQSLFRLIETDRAILFAMILCALNTVLYLLPAPVFGA